jgi:hypothetical protein
MSGRKDDRLRDKDIIQSLLYFGGVNNSWKREIVHSKGSSHSSPSPIQQIGINMLM